MLVILSFALVLVAVVLLVLGLLTTSGLGLIYASMACSLAAGIVLYAAVRMGRPRMQEATAGAPTTAAARPAVDAGERAVAASAPEREALGTVAVLERERPEEPEEEDETAAFVTVPGDETADEDAGYDDDEDFFPIAEYDDLTVSEIMPLLPELYPEELDEVEERERATKARVTILSRISELRDEVRRREAGEEWSVPDEGWRDEEAAGEEEAAGGFPIAGYGDMTAPEIVKHLDGLSASELQQVREREAEGDNRVTVLREIDDRLGAAPASATRKAPAKRTAAAKKAAAKKATKRKAAAKKAPARKTAEKAVAKKAAAKKAAPKKAASKKAAAKKAAGRKSAAKKSSRRR